MTQVGERVLAIRDGEGTNLNIFGEGVYVGDRLRPGAVWPPPQEDYAMLAKVVTEHDDTPIEKHPHVAFYDGAVAAQPDVPPRKDRETMLAGMLAERERPLDVRVRELWEGINENPCIHLDSGDIVWGYQSWWGSLEAASVKYPLNVFTWTVVPVPEGNGRWI